MDLAQTVDDLETAMAAAMPTRSVTGDFIDAPERDDADLKKGVVTLLILGADGLSGPPDLADVAGTARLLVLGQVKVDENTGPKAIQSAELALFEEVRTFAAAPGAGLCPFDLDNVAFSAQLEHPYGWFRCEAVYAEID